MPRRLITVAVLAAVAGLAACADAPPPTPAATAARADRLFTVFFEPGSAAIPAEGRASIEAALAAVVQARPRAVIVRGHADDIGNVRQSMDTSLRRARAVYDVLLDRGVPGDSVVIQGWGEFNQQIPNEPEVRQPEFRRAVIILR